MPLRTSPSQLSFEPHVFLHHYYFLLGTFLICNSLNINDTLHTASSFDSLTSSCDLLWYSLVCQALSNLWSERDELSAR